MGTTVDTAVGFQIPVGTHGGRVYGDAVQMRQVAQQPLLGEFLGAVAVEEGVELQIQGPQQRLAEFLLEEVQLEGSPILKITHEKIANHMGTAREVVTRMLRYFQNEGMVKLTRGAIEITDPQKLSNL